MTSTPVSLNDESLNGSWIDIDSASQIHSPMDNDSPEYLRPPHSVAESVQNLGIISFQVERFLQEAQKLNNNDNINNSSGNIGSSNNNTDSRQQQQIVDNISDIYLSDSDLSNDGVQQGNKSLMDNLRKHHKKYQKYNQSDNNNDNYLNQISTELIGDRLSKSGECLLDQVSDSLSMLSRASFMADAGQHLQQQQQQHFDTDEAVEFQDFDWLWDWTAQPEYFTGQEWKVCQPKHQDYMMNKQQQQEGLDEVDYCTKFSRYQNHNHQSHHPSTKNFSGDMMSLLVLTNILSIIIGAGLTYSILMRKSNV